MDESRHRASLEALELLSIVSDRFSHSIRTHVGIAVGIIEDASGGYELSKEDYADGKEALQSILSTLDATREISGKPEFKPESLRLSSILEEGIGLKAGFDLRIQIEPSKSEREIDPALFIRALRCLCSYAVSRKRRFVSSEESSLYLKLSAESEEVSVKKSSREILELFCRHGAAPDYESLKAKTDFQALVQEDQSIESLGLLFAQGVMQLHGAEAGFTYPDPSTVIFRIVFG